MIARYLWNLPVAVLLVVIVSCLDYSGTALWLAAAVMFANFVGYAEGRWFR